MKWFNCWRGKHEWGKRIVTSKLESQFFYGDNIQQTCKNCGHTQKGWTQRGKTFLGEEMQLVHWIGGSIEKEILTPAEKAVS